MDTKPQVENNADTEINALLQNMVESTPEVQQHVVDHAKSKAQSAPNDDTTFDATIHRVDASGNPVLTKTGKYRRKTVKGEKKLNLPNSDAPTSDLSQSRPAAEIVQTIKRTLYENFLDFKYSEPLHQTHVEVTTAYFDSTGGVKLSPLGALALMEASLFVGAIKTDKGIKKLGKVKAWVAGKWISIRNRKNGAHFDSRPDNERQDDNGEKAGKTKKGNDE